MLFLALPPADMLPPAGHRAGPGRAHTGPITRSGRPGGRPSVSPRWCGGPRPRLPHKVPQTPPPVPALPGAAGPAAGAGDRGWAGTGPKSQCGRNPGLESAGRGCLECHGTPGRSPGGSLPPCSTSGCTGRPTPPALGDGAYPHVRAPRYWAGRTLGGQVGTVFSEGPNEADALGPILPPENTLFHWPLPQPG